MSASARRGCTAVFLVAALLAAGSRARTSQAPAGQGFSFNTGVALINVAATVTDENGRFVSGLTARDFQIYEDGVLQPVQQFEAERVPVSLGIALDTSGSMYGEKIAAAETALNRFLFTLLGSSDQVFLYRFSERPRARARLDHGSIDGVARARNREAGGRDGALRHGCRSRLACRNGIASEKGRGGDFRRQRQSKPDEAVGTRRSDPQVRCPGVCNRHRRVGAERVLEQECGRARFPCRRPSPAKVPRRSPRSAPPSNSHATSSSLDRVNPDALRALTDDSGGRTEIISSPSDLDPVTAGIADELSRQYFLGYSSPADKDGRWHTIDVRLAKPGAYVVRARRGFHRELRRPSRAGTGGSANVPGLGAQTAGDAITAYCPRPGTREWPGAPDRVANVFERSWYRLCSSRKANSLPKDDDSYE